MYLICSEKNVFIIKKKLVLKLNFNLIRNINDYK